MSGPSLQTFELDAWARSRQLSRADAEQIHAVFEERDRLLKALEDLLVDATLFADQRLPWSSQHVASIGNAAALIAEICP